MAEGLAKEVEDFGFRPFADDEPLHISFRAAELSDGIDSPEALLGIYE